MYVKYYPRVCYVSAVKTIYESTESTVFGSSTFKVEGTVCKLTGLLWRDGGKNERIEV